MAAVCGKIISGGLLNQVTLAMKSEVARAFAVISMEYVRIEFGRKVLRDVGFVPGAPLKCPRELG